MRTKIFILISSTLLSCNIKKPRKLNSVTKQEISKIVKELKLEQFEYEYISKSKNFDKTKVFFSVTLYNIDDSIDFLPYNERIIKAFNLSGYNLQSEVDYITFYYIKDYFKADLIKFYKIRAKDLKVVDEAND